ncbi:vesicle transport protein SFT2B [Rhodnius prolixus]|uniref:Vesicle transport protein n=2 Tax=Rhodnius TaxID=13248 RepID=R4FLW7_RHOPR
MDKLKRFLNGDDRDDDSSTGIIPNLDATSLSWSTRITGFIVCFIIGIILSLFGSLSLFLHKGLSLFAIFYTTGNIVSLLSTCFLMGPVKQLKRMFAPTRVISTVLVIVMIGVTLFAAIYLKNAPLCLLFLILQWLAMVWYSLSYIPYARDAVKKTFESCIA